MLAAFKLPYYITNKTNRIMCEIYKRFENVKSFADYLKNGKTQEIFTRHESSKSDDFRFTGTKSYTQANELMLFGDIKLQQKIEKAGVADVRTNLRKFVTHKRFVSGVCGAIPNVPAYLAGAPNSMIDIKAKKEKQRVVNVGYNSAVFGGVGADEITTGGAKLISALMILEAKGIKANVYCLDLDTVGKQFVSYSIKIKSSGQKFDTLRMAYFLAHPSMNRRHKFRFTEVTEGVTEGFVWGYGCPETDDEKITLHFRNKCRLNLDAAFNYQSLSQMTIEQIINKILG